jgi:short-subunit dehydrogenase
MNNVIITGASRGIGRALAVALAGGSSKSERIILTARNETNLGDTARGIEAAGANAH